jgi:hypothetical protein
MTDLTELDSAIKQAFHTEGDKSAVNQAHLTLLRSILYLPVQKDAQTLDPEEPFTPLFTKVDDQYFMLVFDTLERLQTWAGDQLDAMAYVELAGTDIIAGLNKNVYLGLNLGCEYYKEFSPDEVNYLKQIVARLNQLKTTG